MIKENFGNILKKNIRIFISSTFKDLAKERNYLMRRTFPTLRDEAMKFGVSITELDLRWGITENESRLGQVLQICLEEIDNAVPFFIGIIGKRYGWIPLSEDINQKALERFPQVKTYLEDKISITEMEIRYGVLSRHENLHALFFVSQDDPDDSDPEEYEKLINLKQLVLENGKYPVYPYVSPKDISDKVEEYFIKLLNSSFLPKPKSPIEEEMDSQYLYANNATKQYIENVNYSMALDNWIQTTNSVILVQGESGIGKSTFLANWILKRQKEGHSEEVLIPQFVGHGGNHCSGEYLKNVIYQRLSQFDDSDKDDLVQKTSLDQRLSLVIKNLPDNIQCVIVIDGINQIVEDDKNSFLKWVPNIIPDNVKIILSSTLNDYNSKKVIAHGACVLDIKPLTVSDKNNFITNYLLSGRKKLDGDIIKVILDANIFNNTLALRVFLDSIILFSDYESINLDIHEFSSCSSISDFYQKVLSKIDEEFGFATSEKVFSYIFVSKRGLYENEITELCDVTPLVWAQMFRLMRHSLLEDNGRIRFAHSYLEDAVMNHYLKSDTFQVNDYKKSLINYLEAKENLRTRNELPFLYSELGMLDMLYNYIMAYDVADYYLNYNVTAFASFWNKLLDYSPLFKITDYLDYGDACSDDFLSLLGRFCFRLMGDSNTAQMIFEFKLNKSKKSNEDFDKTLSSVFGDLGITIINMPDWIKYTGSLCNLGDVKYREGSFMEALGYYHKAVGSMMEEKDFLDYTKLEKQCMPHEFFNHDSREYFRAAYVFHCLGMTYDELGYLEIACLMYQRAEDYLDRTDDDTDLRSQIYNDWAISLCKEDPEKSITLFERSIDYAKDYEAIPSILCAMGAVYNDNLELPEKALECYNKAIDIENKLNREGYVLGDLYHNRCLAWKNMQDRINDLNTAIALYKKSSRPDKMVKAYETFAIIYYNESNYSSSLHYYLISHQLSYIFLGHDDSKTHLLKNEVLESFQLVRERHLEILDETIYYLAFFLHRYEFKLLDVQELEKLIECYVEDLYTLLTNEIDDNEEPSIENTVFLRSCLVIYDIEDFYNAYNCLPEMDSRLIEALLVVIIGNEEFYDSILDFVNTVEISDWERYTTDKLLKWEAYCTWMYLQHQNNALTTDKLLSPIIMAGQLGIKDLIDESESIVLPATVQILNNFVYDAFIPKYDYDAALMTIDFILTIDSNAPEYLDTKAEILYRLGKIDEAISLVNQVRALDSSFYPEGNEFIYNSLKELINWGSK